ncbi:glutamate synthase large subunit [Micrococcales bacterium 31B]|nr:glutamate synthase large subunit [Micrococcales bacterium 31B]
MGDRLSVQPLTQPLNRRFSALPEDQGLYRTTNEHDACGVALVAKLGGEATHEVVRKAVQALENLEHRGAVGAEPTTGDGAGILTQVPDAFFRKVLDVKLPEPGHYAAGTAYLPSDAAEAEKAERAIRRIATEEGLKVIAWRDVPVVDGLVGPSAKACQPTFRQVFLSDPAGKLSGLDLERKAYAVRRRAENTLGVYFPSLSCRTMVYKGMLTTEQLSKFYPDLNDESFASTLAIVHSRFSTNTFPSWPLAHPFRMIAHNGEINTVKGNRNWMATRESQLKTDVFGKDIERLLPINAPGASDSASFDEVLELLNLSGRSLPHAVLMMIPEAWENHTTMDPKVRAFYEYHAATMEPWDGPACVTFTDGRLIGAVLDRNGLRPGRYWVTTDGHVILGSESGVLDLDPAEVVSKGRLEPGKMFLVDTVAGRIIGDQEIKRGLASELPYGQWLESQQVRLSDLPDREHIMHTRASVVRRQQTFGYTEEELRVLLAPLAQNGAEPLGAMGTDTPIAVLSERPRLIFDYFTQLFAQVTNPPLDAIREEMVTALGTSLGPECNLLDATPRHARQIIVDFPVIDNDELAKISHIDSDPNTADFHTVTLRGLYSVEDGEAGLRERLDAIRIEASRAVERGASFIILSDRDSNAKLAPIPSLLLLSAVHHHLIRTKQRTQVGLIVEAGDVREVHHVALLIGFGAAVVNPYLAMETVEDLVARGLVQGVTGEQAVKNLIKALGKGVLKVMSKMGISTVSSYRGAQVFEAIGLSQDLVDEYFSGTTSQLGGIDLDVIAEEVARRHALAYPTGGNRNPHRRLDVGGEYQWRREGEPHLFDPETVFRLQHSTRQRKYDEFRKYTQRIDDQAKRLMTLRGLFELKEGALPAVPIDEVEPVSSIVKRFATGAMSYGSISREAHETLAIAMNRLGGMSNTGEGGEDPDRLYDPERRSAIKQIASGRFGVTSEYLTNADDIQIKVAQGAKPGEGGQLPPHKVYPWVAKTRHSTPGVGLISPPPHHDIYSIEDLAQLIHDAKNANPAARIHVKLVSEIGVGTVAAGVSKAHADVVLISGHDGGTGASPLTSLKHAGAPWELGLAETQQTLLINRLRDRIRVQVDGQLKTGRDVVIGALLGAEEFGFATAPLVVSGCIMMRVCHLDTCPVGVATQNPELRERFSGKAEYVVTFFEYIAEEVREILASMGLRSLDEAVGRADLLDTRAATQYWKAQGLDLAPLLHMPAVASADERRCTQSQDHGLQHALDNELIAKAKPALEKGEKVTIDATIRNVNRTAGTMLGHEVTKRYRGEGLPTDTITVNLTGSAGQSFGAFLPAGVTLRLEGDANDYVGKGLSGGRIVVRPSQSATFASHENVIAGNTIGYGATSGELFLSGTAGERFAVRNSGATIIVEGVGDHGCEYMTGGTVIVLGPIGRNFGAGFSGGEAYLLDLDRALLNPDAVKSGDLVITDLDEADVTGLGAWLTQYAKETDSSIARDLLAEGELAKRFTKVFPREFAKVRAIRAEAVEEGIDPDSNEVWTRIVEASHG